MGLDIFFREDILNALWAADEANHSPILRVGIAEDSQVRAALLLAYQEGFQGALLTIAAAFGVSQDFTGRKEQDASH